MATTRRSIGSRATSTPACGTSCCSRVPASKRLHDLRFDHLGRAVGRDQSAVRRRAASLGGHLPVRVDRARPLRAPRPRRAHRSRSRRSTRSRPWRVEVADAGADGVSPSDMMDGRTAHLRAALDDAGHDRVPIMSYSTKFASQFYGPFREAAGSAPQFGDRRHYQIDVRSRRDAIASSVRCASEGADLLMVKPGLTSLDLISPIAEATGRAGRRLPGERRVRGPAGARRAGPDRSRRRAARDVARLPPRRRGVHHHLRRARRARPRPRSV